MQLTQVLAGDYPHLWTGLGAALAAIDSPHTVAPLIAVLQQDGYPHQREAAAYALGWLTLVGERAHAACSALVAALNTSAEAPPIRAQAAESLAYRFGDRFCTDEHVRPDATAALSALRMALGDASPELRFWAAFALGQLRDAEALPALHALTADPTVVPGWWTVGEEAADAITTTAGGEPPERMPRLIEPKAAQ